MLVSSAVLQALARNISQDPRAAWEGNQRTGLVVEAKQALPQAGWESAPVPKAMGTSSARGPSGSTGRRVPCPMDRAGLQKKLTSTPTV